MERGILFKGEMVRAILDGRKTESRRTTANGLNVINANPNGWNLIGVDTEAGTATFADAPGNIKKVKSRYGGAGSRLWVRETWRPCRMIEDSPVVIEYKADGGKFIEPIWAENSPRYIEQYNSMAEWLADNIVIDPVRDEPDENGNISGTLTKWKPAIHLPRWASRITMVRSVLRFERLQEIPETGAQAEGVTLWRGVPGDRQEYFYRSAFRRLWKSIHGEESWDANHWVEVVGWSRRSIDNGR